MLPLSSHSCQLTRSIRDSETSIDFEHGPPSSHRERVNLDCVAAEKYTKRVQTSPKINLRFTQNKTPPAPNNEDN